MFRIRDDKDTLYLFDDCLVRTRQCDRDDIRDSTKLAPWSSAQLGDPYGVVNWLTFVPDWNREVIIRSNSKVQGQVRFYHNTFTFQDYLWNRGFFMVYDNTSMCYAGIKIDSGIDFLPNRDPIYAPIIVGSTSCNVKLTEWRTR